MLDGTERSPERSLLKAVTPRTHHQRMLQIVRAMTPQQKLDRVFKLNKRELRLLRHDLRQVFPHLDDTAFEKVYLQTRMQLHNWNS
jgi:hypothetical protein